MPYVPQCANKKFALVQINAIQRLNFTCIALSCNIKVPSFVLRKALKPLQKKCKRVLGCKPEDDKFLST